MTHPPPRLRVAFDHLRAGRLPAARALIEAVLRRAPSDTDANSMMCWVLREAGELERALYFARRALEGAPSDHNLLVNLANLLARTGDTDAAIAAYERARAADPAHDGAAVGLSSALGAAYRLDEALAVSRAALAGNPGHPKHTANAASALLYMGRAREAVAMLREAVTHHPGDPALARGLCVAGLYAGGVSAAESRDHHRRFAALFAPMLPAASASIHPGQPLRIGLVSGDFRRHACASFIEPLLAHLDGDRYPTICYFTRPETDDVTSRLRGLAGGWRDAARWPTEQFVAAIRADRIDVLLDLSGLTDGHRLDVFARRPAPVQATWLGYPSGTGLPALSLRLVDALTDPPKAEDGTDRPVRIDGCSVCYQPPVDPPAPERRDADAPFTFGAFNALAKLDDDTVCLWAGALRAAPGSRLLVRTPASRSAGVREFTRARFEREGIEPARVLVEPPVETAREVLAAYSRVDACLDPVPYNGTTTTCEALLMGVPVITRVGATTASRMGLSLLTHAGCPEWIAPDTDAFARMAASLAARGPRPTTERAALRARFLASSVCDGAGFAERFGACLRAIASS